MPTYEYACSSCDATHEVQQKMSDPTLTECPVCGQPGVRKLFSGVGIHFKGSGFYRTDSRGAAGSAKGSDSSSSSSTTAGSGSSTSSATSGSSSSGSSSSSPAPAAASAG